MWPDTRGDDDPYERPEYVDDHMKYLEEYAEESGRRSEAIANEKHDLSDLF